jgi:hypothetical protein
MQEPLLLSSSAPEYRLANDTHLCVIDPVSVRATAPARI